MIWSKPEEGIGFGRKMFKGHGQSLDTLEAERTNSSNSARGLARSNAGG